MYLTVCSDKLIRVRAWPLADARADTKLVLPTPGSPSNIRGRLNCKARSSRSKLSDGPFAVRQYSLTAAVICDPILKLN